MMVAKNNSEKSWQQDIIEREQNKNTLAKNGLPIEIER